MGEVAVHLEDQVGAQLEGAGEAREIRGTEPFLVRAVENVNPIVGFGQAVGDLTGPVR